MKDKKEVYYVKSADDEMYKELIFEEEKSLAARREMQAKKKPTSVALDEKTINDLKALAADKGIPYQVLMRSYIIEGIKKDKKGAI
jgi:predicted DNA binding CopG/RHH family protein